MKTPTKALIIAIVCSVGLVGGYILSEKFVTQNKSTHAPAPPQISIGSNFINEWMEKTDYFRPTPYGNYLIGNFAQKEKDWMAANDYIGRVLKKEKTIDLEKHAMVLAMGAGDAQNAIQYADKVIQNDPGDLLATLFKTTENFKNENYTAVSQTLKFIEKDSIAAFIVPVLHLWADASKGTFSTDKLGKNTFFTYHAMLAGNFLGKKKEALSFANTHFSLSTTDLRDLERMADLYAHLGDKEKAQELYQLLIKEKFITDDIEKKLITLKNKEPIENIITPPDIKTPKDGVSYVFLNMAEILARERSMDSAMIFSNMSLYLNPELHESRMLLARIIAENEQYDDAISVFKEIPENYKDHLIARRAIANLLVEKEQNDEAIKILEDIYNNYEDLDALVQIGDIHRYEENYDKAVKAYDRVVKNFDEVPERYWHVLYARGMAYERLKKFKKSEEDLLAALEYRPEHPFLLNYLGYSWADQGVNLDKAMEMINKAFEIKPDDGYIADSVGWVHYKMKNYDEAVQYLETATELLPYDATINDHLGDAYWKVGRKTEAKFQWQRAYNNAEEREAELKEKIQIKLTYGYLDEEKMVQRLEEKTK